MSDATWAAIVGGGVAITVAYFNYRLGKISKVADATHILVNSSMGAQLRLSATALRRLADMPGATEADKEAAKLAELLSKEHDLKQAMVDVKA